LKLRTQFQGFPVRLIPILSLLLGATPRSSALTFHLTYDATTVGAPAGFFTAFQAAIDFIQSTYSDPVTINLQVGWGKINGQNLNPGNLGQSSAFQSGFYNYNQIKTALTNDAKSADDATAIANLPAADPTGGALFVMANAEAKALGLLAGNAPGLDGYVGFSTNAVYTFDPNNRAVAGAFDFFGLACHEITEVMGRYGLRQNGASSGRYSPIDLFRYSSPVVLDLAPTNCAYFSIDGGNTVINTFNGTSGGDLSDWAGRTFDAFNHSLDLGQKLDVSDGDMVEMDVIGYDRVFAPPSLMVRLNGANNLLIFWSSPSSGFVLQTNSDLATTNWFPANLTVSMTKGTNYSATLSPPSKGNLFFRLKW
jgi:hypothetical protein